MGKPADLKRQIKELEPENKVAADPRATESRLERELKAAQRRTVQRRLSEGGAVAQATVRFRQEDDGFSWKVEWPEGLGEVEFGKELPPIGSVVGGENNEPLVVCEHIEGLTIHAADLMKRELFDPRRKYSPKMGGEIVFKRMEGGKPIVWAFGHCAEMRLSPSMVLTRTDQVAKPNAQQARIMTQKILSAYVIHLNPEITGPELTEILRRAFPNASIGKRHGPHYLSLSRNNKLDEPPDSDPREW